MDLAVLLPHLADVRVEQVDVLLDNELVVYATTQTAAASVQAARARRIACTASTSGGCRMFRSASAG